ncbi:hypothetical protein MtrunA17_Chr3g0095021 [Medicago truncatula]|uniref:Uncharacterized protein n=1 Tax=Medicago truncatula TaxID=3880 RepID=A0A396IS36_MEDTR|nr:hypothetical protein MtrunA17_Chr3g0095021 [Medicago truncatula]
MLPESDFDLNRFFLPEPEFFAQFLNFIFNSISQFRVYNRFNLGIFLITKGKKIAFIMEFAENLVLKLMEDPNKRDRRFREHVYKTNDRCAKMKEMWSYPMQP